MSDWVRCDFEMPKSGQFVWAYSIERGVVEDYYLQDKFTHNDVTHWQPFIQPAPPEGHLKRDPETGVLWGIDTGPRATAFEGVERSKYMGFETIELKHSDVIERYNYKTGEVEPLSEPEYLHKVGNG